MVLDLNLKLQKKFNECSMEFFYMQLTIFCTYEILEIEIVNKEQLFKVST